MNGRCATCKWWHQSEHNLFPSAGWGNCTLTDTEESRDDDNVVAVRFQHPESLAIVDGWADGDFCEDGPFWGARLRTQPDFGCVQWEAKE
jgi:hypothetical protein